jgi:hypothetical protein
MDGWSIFSEKLCCALAMPPRKTTPVTTSSTSSAAQNALQELWRAYRDTTESRLKIVDAFLVFIMLSGVFQFLYFVLVTDFPFNAFISGYVTLHLVFVQQILIRV